MAFLSTLCPVRSSVADGLNCEVVPLIVGDKFATTDPVRVSSGVQSCSQILGRGLYGLESPS
jgi:hypothetical protein